MYYRNQKTPLKKYLLYAAVILTAAGLIFFGGKTLKTELEEARAAAVSPEQRLTSNYSPIENSSQEDTETPATDSESSHSNTASAETPPSGNHTAGEPSSQSSQSPKNSRESSSVSGKSTDSKEYYTITVYDGNIAVFRNDEKRPFNVLDIPAEYFPKEDQELLEAGIRVESLAEAMRLLEDYS